MPAPGRSAIDTAPSPVRRSCRRASVLTPFAIWLIVVIVTGACAVGKPSAGEPAPTVRVLLAGDISLARGVAIVADSAPSSVFQEVRHVIRSADIAAANLESPFTSLADTTGAGLVAAPDSVELLRAAGFDVVGVANNHAGDAGPLTVIDTVNELAAAGLEPVGGGETIGDALRPTIVDVGGITVGFLAVDATGYGPEATDRSAGVAVWNSDFRDAVEALRAAVDIVAVGVHGGGEYLWRPDDTMSEIARDLAALDVDLVWGHGAHVVQPIRLVAPQDPGRPTVVATSLGNLIFDQHLPGTDRGAVLEILAAADGVLAYRIGETATSHGTVRFERWRLPDRHGVLLGREWWTPADQSADFVTPAIVPDLHAFSAGDVTTAAVGDVDRGGSPELVVSFRRPFSVAPLHSLLPDVDWRDPQGRSAHLGVFGVDDLAPTWVASAMARPVAEIAACDGAIAVRYQAFGETTPLDAGAWAWNGFGWDEAPDLRGDFEIGCRDVDLDGLLDPIATTRDYRP